MSRLRIVLAALLAASALAVLAVPASATVPTASTKKFCTAAESVGNGDSSGKPTKAQAKAEIEDFKKVAKYAPGKVKSAINNISKYLGVIAGADNPSDLAKLYTSSGFKNYTKSFTTYIKYYASHCVGTT